MGLMNIYIDTEFNGFNGELISMALISGAGDEFYEVLACDDPTDWVHKNVMPFLNKPSVDQQIFRHKLQAYLICYDQLNIIADWPEDIKHFCNALILGPGQMMGIPPITFELKRLKTDSKVPHNALADARALMEADLGSKYEQGL